jgi:hypothetical protein
VQPGYLKKTRGFPSSPRGEFGPKKAPAAKNAVRGKRIGIESPFNPFLEDVLLIN